MLSIAIAGCLRIPERIAYLRSTMTALLYHFPDADYLIGLDNTSDDMGKEVEKEYPMARVKTHTQGLGHSWNWGIQQAKNDVVLQMEEDWLCTHCWNKDKDNDLTQKIEYGIRKINEGANIVLKLDNGMGIGAPPKSPYQPGWTEYEKCPLTGKQVYELNKPKPKDWYKGWNPYFYSNHPHLKHKRFHAIVGWFSEKQQILAELRPYYTASAAINHVVPRTEFDMCRKVILHPETRMLFYNNTSFVHSGVVSVRE